MLVVRRSLVVCAILLFLFPTLLRADEPRLPEANATHEEIARAAVGATLENLPGDVLLVLYPNTADGKTIFETRYGDSYTKALYLFVPQPRQKGKYQRAVILHYNEPDRDIAVRIGRLVGRLFRLEYEHLGRYITFQRAEQKADIWLNTSLPKKETDVGGETWNNQIYLFRTEPPRKPVEWVRTMVHEWGHLTLPAARGFVSPESDASGFLGERLYFRWLSLDRDRVTDDFVTNDGLDLYDARQNRPLLEQFQEGGPYSPLTKKRDTEGMDYYVAGALAADAAFGSRVLERALFAIESEKPTELLRTLKDTLQNTQPLQVRLPAWVPLEVGRYEITADRAGSLSIADRPPLRVGTKPTTLDTKIAGWKWMTSMDGDIEQLTFRLIRSGAPL